MASEVWVGLFSDRGDPIKAGYAGIKVKGGYNQVRCKRGWFEPKNKN